MSKNTIILYGSGSPLIVEFEELCRQNGIVIEAIIANFADIDNHAINKSLVRNPDEITDLKSKYFLCPFFTPINRFKATKEALGHHLTPFNLLNDSRNLLSIDFKHGVGCFLNMGIICGAASEIGNYVLINRGACLGHHIQIKDFVSIGPGVVTGGNVLINKGALIGTGSTILPGISIGKHAIVGAGSVVTKNVEDYAVVVGNPAKKIKQSKIDF